jgi:hypothetical protein
MKRCDSMTGRAFTVIKATGKTEFTPTEWTRLLNTVAATKGQREKFASYLKVHGYVDSVIRLTDKAKERVGG